MRKILIVVVAVAVLAGGAWYLYLAASLDNALAHLPPGWTAKYAALDIAPAQRTATLTGLVLHYEPPPGVDITVGEIVIENPSLTITDDWAKATANPASLDPATAIPLADALTIRDVKGQFGGNKLVLASVREEKLVLYPWALTRPGGPGLEALPLFASANAAAPPDPAKLAANIRLQAAGLLALGYGRAVSEGLDVSVDVPATDQIPETKFHESFRKAEGAGMERGVIGPTEVEGIDASVGNLGGTSIDRMELGAFDVREPAIRLLNGAVPDVALLDQAKLGRFAMSGVTSRPPKGAPITIGGFAVSDIAFAEGKPISGKVTIDQVHLIADQIPDASAREVFEKLGLDQVTVSFSAAYNWDPAAKHLTLHDTSLSSDELGALDLGAEALDVTVGPDWLKTARLGHAVLHYRDHSLVERAFAYAAGGPGSDTAALRQQAITWITMGTMLFPGDTAIATASNQLAAFFKDPKALTIEISPDPPIGLAEIYGNGGMPPPGIGKRLGLVVTANP
jgi:hypothetical protein